MYSRKRKNKHPHSNHSRPRLEPLEDRNLMAGDLDATFAFGWGQTVTDFGGHDVLTDMVAQTDGKVVAVGHTNFGGSGPNFALARYNIDGSLDSSFGGEGVVADGMTITDFDNLGNHNPSVVVLEDNSILVAGRTTDHPDGRIVLVKYNSNGLLDESFGDDGRVEFVTPEEESVEELLVTDDKVFLVTTLELIRLNLDGSLDTSFGGDGTIHRDEVSTIGVFQSADFHDGRYALGMHDGDSTVGILMLNHDGSPDVTFGAGGLATHVLNAELSQTPVRSLKLQSDGTVIGLTTSSVSLYPIVFKLDADGQELAGNFHIDGRVELSGVLDSARSFIVQPEGTVVIVGKQGDQMAVVRLTPDGELDTNFSENGVKTTYGEGGSLSAGVNYADGKIVVGGTLGLDFFLMRLTGDEYEPQFDGPGGLQRPQGTPQPTGDRPERDPDCDTNPFTTACGLTGATPIKEQRPDRHLDLLPVDGDGDADFSDFLRLANNFGSQEAARADGDMDGDSDVDFKDFLTFAKNFGKQRNLAAAAGGEASTREIAEVAADQVFARGSVLPVGFRVGGLETDGTRADGDNDDDDSDDIPPDIIWDIDSSSPSD